MLPVGFSRSSSDFINSNPYILDQNSGVPVTRVFHAWFDACDLIGGAEGRNTVIFVGLWAWPKESSRAVSWLPCGSLAPKHHPWAHKEKRGWWFCYPILRSRALLRCVCSMAENPYLKCILAPPGTLNLNRTTVFGMSMPLFEKNWEWMRMSSPSCPHLPHTAIPRALIPFSRKGSWQIIKHKDGDTLRQLLSHPASSVSKKL